MRRQTFTALDWPIRWQRACAWEKHINIFKVLLNIYVVNNQIPYGASVLFTPIFSHNLTQISLLILDLIGHKRHLLKSFLFKAISYATYDMKQNAKHGILKSQV